MSDEEPQEAPLERLREQWAKEPTPRLAVRLAEELHRRGEISEAVGILEKGLAQQPGHLAARVALGRYRMDLGDLVGARRTLETVVDRDPTHLVANRMLVDLYIRLGENELARDRLDLYTLLNDRDPEIEGLERRLAGEPEPEAPSPEAAGSTEPEVTEPEPAEPWTVEPAPEPAKLEGPGFQQPEVPEPREPVVVPSDVEPATALPAAPAPRAPKPDAGPFAALWDEARVGLFWREIAAEGIFAWEPIAVRAPKLDGRSAGAPAAVVAEEAAPVLEEATVTLAALYRKQGHLEEAARIYRRVLDRDPGNDAARAGLAAVSGGRGATAAEAVGTPAEVVSETSLERKKAALLDYLRRIRGNAEGPA